MASSPSRVYWDACTWIALIQKEKIPLKTGGFEDRETMCRSVLVGAQRGKIEIVTSTLSLVEVCKSPDIKNGGADRLADFFENDYILLVNLDRMVGERARALMTAGHAKLKPADATHVATAAIASVDELHTFDDALLSLDGIIDRLDGSKLKICRPDPGAPSMPLLEIAAKPATTARH
jgi:predicted nucleic acid-binding protein